jgi:hypothetical protein
MPGTIQSSSFIFIPRVLKEPPWGMCYCYHPHSTREEPRHKEFKDLAQDGAGSWWLMISRFGCKQCGFSH